MEGDHNPHKTARACYLVALRLMQENDTTLNQQCWEIGRKASRQAADAKREPSLRTFFRGKISATAQLLSQNNQYDIAFWVSALSHQEKNEFTLVDY